ncbi:MAG: hypothetical protein HQ591_08290 [candidate division Zixibacteria bacterium]|nr:hypothetical protein [Candidatus Tariuqbacter arcticus]
MLIYVGDSGNVVKRILINHCSGNVEGSALRKHIAKEMGFDILREVRKSGSTKYRINLPNPLDGEKIITEYIRSGWWKYVICDSMKEAKGFQWYAIEKLDPLLNINRKSWDETEALQYKELLEELQGSEVLHCNKLREKPTGPGVYALYHNMEPRSCRKVVGKMEMV